MRPRGPWAAREMTLLVELDPASPVPPYAQLEHQLRTMITTGALVVGDRLPSIRQLASDLGVAAGTIARAYRELERDGLLVSRVRHGTTVAATPVQDATAVREHLRSAAVIFVLTAQTLGVDPDTMLHAVRAAADELGGSDRS